MESRVKLFGHPIHQQLIVFPLGLLATAVAFDVIALLAGDWDALHRAAWYMIAAGIIGGLAAAPFGLVDWLAVPSGTRAKRVGLLHAGANVIALVLFALAWLLRRDDPVDAAGLPIVLQVLGAGFATVGGWLGGELVDRLAVGVDTGANLDAPSSLSGRAATGRREPA